MSKAPAALTSPKIKKLAAKAVKSPSMLTTVETRELGATILAHLSPPQDAAAVPAKKAATKKTATKKLATKKTALKKTATKLS
jgi:hypothetical protein